MKRIRLLINNFHSTSFNYDARETEITRGAEVLHLQTYVSFETVGKNSTVFIAHLSKVLWYRYRWNTRISVSKTWYLYHALWTFHLSLISDVMVTRFSKMAVLLFTKGSFLYYEHQVWFSFKFRGKIYFVIIFNVKIKGSCPLAELPAGVMCIRCSSESISALTRLV